GVGPAPRGAGDGRLPGSGGGGGGRNRLHFGREAASARRGYGGLPRRPDDPDPCHREAARRRGWRSGNRPGIRRRDEALVEITPDLLVYWRWGPIAVNATLVWTWIVMVILVTASWALSRGMKTDGTLTRGQNLLE